MDNCTSATPIMLLFSSVPQTALNGGDIVVRFDEIFFERQFFVQAELIAFEGHRGFLDELAFEGIVGHNAINDSGELFCHCGTAY